MNAISTHCRHRLPAIRTATCTLCPRKGRPIEVHGCAIHGACTVRRYRAGQPERICLICPDRSG